MNRRNLFVTGASAAGLAMSGLAGAQPVGSGGGDTPRTFVLVHGSSHGGWCWARVMNELSARGHRAYAVTQTGLGDRKHLAAAAISIDVFVDDIVNLIEAEELKDVYLVGHSFGGIPITGVGARMPERIRSLLYLDAGVPRSGDSALSSLSPEEQARRAATAVTVNDVQFLMPPAKLPDYWGLSGADADWVARRLTPHPFNTYTTGLKFDEAAWNKVPRTYIQCTAPKHPSLSELKVKLHEDPRWKWVDFAAGHDGMVTHPKQLVEILLA